ncbi:MAG: hypothetical protein ISS68_14475 [Desulfobacteraceae bacterium]|nr:hypothetical protein [Desulfobacteraceae bacterium]
MKLDMHYYGVYALARMAGMNSSAAKVIAYASQYVDDAVSVEERINPVGGRLESEVTAHHAGQIQNLNTAAQRKVWVPFHFMPGGKGENLMEWLVCEKDGTLVREMLDHHLEVARTVDFGLELIGIAAHVYADTFSHWGFSGVSSPLNAVDAPSINVIRATPGTRNYLKEKEKSFFRKYNPWTPVWEDIQEIVAGTFAEEVTSALGHGAVLTYPDLPYLNWSFRYDYNDSDKRERRSNPGDFSEGCEKLYHFFCRFSERLKGREQPHMDFEERRGVIQGILETQTGTAERCELWVNAISSGELFASTNMDRELPEYDSKRWDRQRDGFEFLKNPSNITGKQVFHFYQAAALHRFYLLRELLPEKGIILT